MKPKLMQTLLSTKQQPPTADHQKKMSLLLPHLLLEGQLDDRLDEVLAETITSEGTQPLDEPPTCDPPILDLLVNELPQGTLVEGPPVPQPVLLDDEVHHDPGTILVDLLISEGEDRKAMVHLPLTVNSDPRRMEGKSLNSCNLWMTLMSKNKLQLNRPDTEHKFMYKNRTATVFPRTNRTTQPSSY